MKILRGLFVYIVALCLMCSGLPASLNAQEITPDETKAVAEETQEASALEQDFAQHPLKPPDTSSPRATLQDFLHNMNRAYRVLMAAHQKNTATPGLLTSHAVQQMERAAEVFLTRGVSCLNLSEVPPAIREDMGDEEALMLKEIFDRIALPPFSQIPDFNAIEQEQEQEKVPELDHWRVPNTTITIARVEEGPRKGEYLFTPATVARLDEFYERVEELPYKSDGSTSPDFFDFYISTPGRLLPPKWSRWLPAWSMARYFGQTLWQWGALVIGCFLVLLVLIVLYRRFRSRAATFSTARRLWNWVVFALMAIAMIFLLHYVLETQTNLTGAVLIGSRTIATVLYWLLTATVISFVGRATAETIIASPKIDPEGIQASYIRALFGVLGFVSAAVILIFGLSRVGVALVPLLTAVGVGGLALSLAARPTLENVIGSFMIFADTPYRVGQRIKAMGQDGTVESIGLRSTKIRLLSGHLTSIPNEKMAAVDIENIGRRPYIKRVLNVNITYDTPPEKINRAVEILREILAVPDTADRKPTDSTEELVDSAGTEELVETAATEGEIAPHPNEPINQPDFPPRVYFNDLNADSLNILVTYWYQPPDYWDYLEHAHWVNLRIMERFHAEGIDFAFPTQTLHLAGDDKRPLTVGQRWVSEEEALSPSAILAQAAALGAQAVQTSQTPVSDAVQPQAHSPPTASEEQTDAPLEEETLFGDDQGKTGASEDDGDAER